jgi:hypothetical protein
MFGGGIAGQRCARQADGDTGDIAEHRKHALHRMSHIKMLVDDGRRREIRNRGCRARVVLRRLSISQTRQLRTCRAHSGLMTGSHGSQHRTAGIRQWRDAARAPSRDHGFHRTDDAGIAGAAAEIAADRPARIRRSSASGNRSTRSRADTSMPGRAVATLERVLAGEGGPQLGRDRVRVETLDRGNRARRHR